MYIVGLKERSWLRCPCTNFQVGKQNAFDLHTFYTSETIFSYLQSITLKFCFRFYRFTYIRLYCNLEVVRFSLNIFDLSINEDRLYHIDVPISIVCGGGRLCIRCSLFCFCQWTHSEHLGNFYKLNSIN